MDATLDCGYTSAWRCGRPLQQASGPAGLIRTIGLNCEVDTHQASEVWTQDVGIHCGPSHLSINEIVSKIVSMWGESRGERMSKGYQMLYINEEAAVEKTRIFKCIASAQREDPADLGRYGSAKDV
ncbi:hypothetical protein C8J57DRAFT_1229893 [Mycena rebaudengoi]|nr:hypothetical protein C8J57DRAFT_1229893 [Mycena rebaudengoi]